jgi:hypothetical protein
MLSSGKPSTSETPGVLKSVNHPGANTMGKRSDRRGENNLRIVLAQEAARLICDHGIEDYRTAKQKAAENLGYSTRGALPANREIESAVAERNRIFGADQHKNLLSEIRRAAIAVMNQLQQFRPHLVGAALSGNVTEHSAIKLHLFSDPSENVAIQLSACGVRYSSVAQRLKIQRDLVEQFPGYRFYADDFAVEATVFPERRKAHAPLSPLDGRPMKRAKLRDVEMLADDT